MSKTIATQFAVIGFDASLISFLVCMWEPSYLAIYLYIYAYVTTLFHFACHMSHMTHESHDHYIVSNVTYQDLYTL